MKRPRSAAWVAFAVALALLPLVTSVAEVGAEVESLDDDSRGGQGQLPSLGDVTGVEALVDVAALGTEERGIKAKDADEVTRWHMVKRAEKQREKEVYDQEAQRREQVKTYAQQMERELIGHACSPALCHYLNRELAGVPKEGYKGASPLAFNSSVTGKPVDVKNSKSAATELVARKAAMSYAHAKAREYARKAETEARSHGNRLERAFEGAGNLQNPLSTPEQAREDAKRHDWARYFANVEHADSSPQANKEPYPTNSSNATVPSPAPSPAAAVEELRESREVLSLDLRESSQILSNSTNGTKKNFTVVDEAARLANAKLGEKKRFKTLMAAQKKLNDDLLAQQVNNTKVAETHIRKKFKECKCKRGSVMITL